MAKKIEKKKDDDEDLVMVGPGSDDDEHDDDVGGDKPEKDEDEGEDEEDSDSPRKKTKAKAKEDEDGDSDEDDERVGHGEDDEEDDGDGKSKKRERESRKARRERQRRARLRNETELNFLRQQNETLEKRIRDIDTRIEKSEAGSIDQRINAIQSQLKVADQVLAKAQDDGSGEDVVEALNIRDRLKETLGRLSGAKQELSRRSEESEQEQPVDSRLVFHASRWMKSHSWYDPHGTDRDSRIVSRIDNTLVERGFDPRTPEYWDELSDLVKEKLPHKFKNGRRSESDDDDDLEEEEDDRESRGSGKSSRGSGPKFSTGGRERPLRKNEVYVSPERKQAMVDAGVWEDPVLRNKYLKTYKKWDQENGGSRRAAR